MRNNMVKKQLPLWDSRPERGSRIAQTKTPTVEQKETSEPRLRESLGGLVSNSIQRGFHSLDGMKHRPREERILSEPRPSGHLERLVLSSIEISMRWLGQKHQPTRMECRETQHGERFVDRGKVDVVGNSEYMRRMRKVMPFRVSIPFSLFFSTAVQNSNAFCLCVVFQILFLKGSVVLTVALALHAFPRAHSEYAVLISLCNLLRKPWWRNHLHALDHDHFTRITHA